MVHCKSTLEIVLSTNKLLGGKGEPSWGPVVTFPDTAGPGSIVSAWTLKVYATFSSKGCTNKFVVVTFCLTCLLKPKTLSFD